jgi:hypothetical protein
VRQEAERLFAIHEEEAGQAARLKSEADTVALSRERSEGVVVATFDDAKRDLDCILGTDFLYWPAREDNKIVYATPLIDDKTSYVLPLSPGKLYRCDPRLGIDGLVAVEGSERRREEPPAEPATSS